MTREELEATLWELTEWRGEAAVIDQLLTTIDQHVERCVQTEVLTRLERILDESASIIDARITLSQGLEAMNGPRKPGRPLRVAGTELPPVVVGFDPETHKVCRGCNEPKERETAFNREAKAKDGRASKCKRCVREKKLGLR